MYDGVQGVCVAYCRVGVHVFSVTWPGFWCSNLLDPPRMVSGVLMGWSGIVSVALYAWEVGPCGLLAVGFSFR